ncbi:peptide MFS transporter [Hyunsoonleella pacifica]|uniref:MFS transporter n=1 Tax=Hyunsoonleella pacifica TaxID=1080224 RepID=A0A4Q9FPU7_9FLAO|nr:peptide MFS transporter [Hyunsoonleella pacifica]TBN14712.1 MFS transporter [Hyunsoonleella pacifica]GGD16059.1 MFS transporter [Hyunsoonleella pacifica]
MDFVLGLIIVGWLFCLIWIPLVIKANWKIHPRALFVCFFAEMWERFSYYGMRALLTLYMVKVVFQQISSGEADVKSLAIYGSYTASIYLGPIIGGIMADKYLGFRKAILLGGILISIGHIVLAAQGIVAETNELFFFVALSFIVVGTGYFKPNISSFLGKFYDQDDSRKDSAYNIFYMGINVGAFLSALTCGYLGEEVGWHWGFGLAGIGMLLGLFVFWKNLKHFGKEGLVPQKKYDDESVFAGFSLNKLIILLSFIAVPLWALLFSYDVVFKFGLTGITIAVLAYLIYLSTKYENGSRLLVVLILFLFHAMFWALFEQAGGSLTLITDRFVDRSIGNSEIPASQFQALNAFFIIVFAPVFSWLWMKLNKLKKEPSTPLKFVYSLVLLAIGFLVIVMGATSAIASGQKIIIWAIVFMYLFHTLGELCLSPVGLSMVTKLSPGDIVGFSMGAWFLSYSVGNKMATEIGKLISVGNIGESSSMEAQIQPYIDVYLNWGVYVVLGCALGLLCLVPVLKKLMKGIR